jgi:hypothetical protein
VTGVDDSHTQIPPEHVLAHSFIVHAEKQPGVKEGVGVGVLVVVAEGVGVGVGHGPISVIFEYDAETEPLQAQTVKLSNPLIPCACGVPLQPVHVI